MSTASDITQELVSDLERQAGPGATSNFRFLPRELAVKCRALIESYHEMLGYGCLPDMLWHSNARDVIEYDGELAQLFKNAAKSRRARQANDTLLLIATVVVSLEMLTRDFAGWAKQCPAAKGEAERLLGGQQEKQRAWLTDMYLYPSLGTHREFARALAPSITADQTTVRS